MLAATSVGLVGVAQGPTTRNCGRWSATGVRVTRGESFHGCALCRRIRNIWLAQDCHLSPDDFIARLQFKLVEPCETCTVTFDR
ncbi:MAG: hypothetical protein RIT02_3800 [Planctomycetota bacterium]